MKVYVASPLGFSEAGRHFYYSSLIPAIASCGCTILDPWGLTDAAAVARIGRLPYGTGRRNRWRRLNKIIGLNNATAIKQCDAIVAVLDGSDVDSGTAAEIGFGCAHGKLVFGYRSDFRLASDNEGSLVNLQIAYFVQSSGGTIVVSLASLRHQLRRFNRNSIPYRRRK